MAVANEVSKTRIPNKKDDDEDVNSNRGEVYPSRNGLSSVPMAVFNLTKVLIGAGVFTGPEAMYSSGYIGCSILIIAATVVMFVTSKIILDAGDKYSVDSYRGLCGKVMGRWGSLAESIVTFIFTLGSITSYGVIIADSLPPFLIQISGWKISELENGNANELSGLSVARYFLDRRILLLLSTIFILYPLLLMPNVHFLSYSSIFGLFCFTFIFIVLSQRALTIPEESKGSLSPSSAVTFFKWSGIISAISRASFMNITHHMNFIVTNSLKKRTPRNINIVICTCLAISTLCILVFSSIMYFQFNDRLANYSNVFNIFSSNDILVNFCRLALSFHIMASFCLNGFACRESLFRLVLGDTHSMDFIRRVVFVTIVVVIPVAIAMFTCNLGVVVDITGGAAAGALTTIFPGIIWMIMAKREGIQKPKWKHVLNYILIIYGTLLALYSIAYNLYLMSTSGSVSGSTCQYRFF